MVKVTILIPCLNEEAAIADLILSLRKFDSICELLVIDNGSSDKTLQIAHRLGINVLTESRLGKGRALRAGLAQVKTPFVIFLDGDNTLDIEVIPRMIQLLDEGFDMVVANRIATSQDTFRKFHRTGNFLFSALHNIFLKTAITDVLCGFRGIRTDLANIMNLKSEGYEIEIELNIKASRLRCSTANLDCHFSKRKDSASKLRTIPDGSKLLFHFFKILTGTRK